MFPRDLYFSTVFSQEEEKERVKEIRLKMYAEKKAKSESQNIVAFSKDIWTNMFKQTTVFLYNSEPVVVAKSNIILDVKPVRKFTSAVWEEFSMFLFTYECTTLILCYFAILVGWRNWYVFLRKPFFFVNWTSWKWCEKW